jgi:hypothetical protein
MHSLGGLPPRGRDYVSKCRVGKAKRAHQSDNAADGWWARRKRAFAHPTRLDAPHARGMTAGMAV